MTRLDSRRRRLLQIPKPVNVADIVWHPSKANAT